MRDAERDICYLCGESIENSERTADHVPPLQIFPSGIRQTYNLSRLQTLPSHRACNESYQRDEDYFFHTIGSVSHENLILQEVWHDIRRRARQPASYRFNQMLLGQIREEARSPSGIILPGRSGIEYNRCRISRVVWKIIRGLFYIESSSILPEDTLHATVYVHGSNTGLDSEPVSRIYTLVRNQEEHGEYRGVFAYKHLVNPDENNVAAWALLFWNRHIFMAVHHDPDCGCDRCRAGHHFGGNVSQEVNHDS